MATTTSTETQHTRITTSGHDIPSPGSHKSSPKFKEASDRGSTTPRVKEAKQKILLMGKSGSGKSSMRNIIFSNYVAKDVRRLGATIDVAQSRVKFLGNLVLNLWDCGGQDAFMETFFTTQKQFVFADVGVLIYVFDIESRDTERDFGTYVQVIKCLEQLSPNACVFCLVHKMDLVQIESREAVFQERRLMINRSSRSFAKGVTSYATTIWDQSLYKAWGNIVNSLIPNMNIIEDYLNHLAESIEAQEVVLFEQSTFLAVKHVRTVRGDGNLYPDRLERLSHILKTFKHSLATFTESSSSSHQFNEFYISAPTFNLIISDFTSNTCVLCVFPPGDPELTCARINIGTARQEFYDFDIPITSRPSSPLSGKNSPGLTSRSPNHPYKTDTHSSHRSIETVLAQHGSGSQRDSASKFQSTESIATSVSSTG